MRNRDRRFKVTYTQKNPPYWEITHDDGRWWSVGYNKDFHDYTGVYLITNRAGRILSQHGPTGQKVLDALHNYERNT